MKLDTVHSSSCQSMPELPDNSIDQMLTDPPYGIAFMGKSWDRAIPPVAIWRECLRVLKPGAFAFVMCIPRQDCLARMIMALDDAGFWVGFTSMFHAFASGFPKAQNIGKVVDKRMGAERKVVGKAQHPTSNDRVGSKSPYQNESHLDANYDLTLPATPQAQALDGSYAGFQPKPAVEVILVAMKPMSEKNFVDQALKNGKGVTWLDDGRVPYENSEDKKIAIDNAEGGYKNPLLLSKKSVFSNQIPFHRALRHRRRALALNTGESDQFLCHFSIQVIESDSL